jgi:hypothetical protein
MAGACHKSKTIIRAFSYSHYQNYSGAKGTLLVKKRARHQFEGDGEGKQWFTFILSTATFI